jgi:hypothetical protein
MLHPVRARFAVALVAVLSGAAPTTAAERLAQAAPEPSAPPAAGSAFAAESFEARVAAFIERFYLSGEALSDDELNQLYAATVAYFGGGMWPRERVIADKRAYFKRWPRRQYRLLRETLRVAALAGRAKTYDVTFDYTFEVASADKVSRGRGRARLTLDLALEGGRITRETGDVIERW